MTTAFRSAGTRRSAGCWTCKLRRKKCTEEHPICFACSSRTIECHGYGDRPAFMDDANTQKTELENIQQLVKENKRRQRRRYLKEQAEAGQKCSGERSNRRKSQKSRVAEADQHEAPYEASSQQLSTHSRNMSSASPAFFEAPHIEEYRPHPQTSSHSPSWLHHESIVNGQRSSLVASPLATRDVELSSAPLQPEPSTFRFSHHREAELLMHYLDHVFGMQFRFHVPNVSSGGRGWLLWLLTETKPLYSAVLSLGALHQHSLLRHELRGSRYHDAWNELNDHHNRALQELQIFLQTSYEYHASATDRKRKLQILACGVAFISFELFRGGISDWQLHLEALTTVLSSMIHDRNTGLSSSSRASQPQSPLDRSTTSIFSRSSEEPGLEDTAEHFLIGAIIWFESLSCASTGRVPRLLQDYPNLLLSSDIDMTNIAGFQSWIVFVIGEIGALRAWKTEEEYSNRLSIWKLYERGSAIRQRLDKHIETLRSEISDSIPVTNGALGDATAVYLVMANPSLYAQAVRRVVTLVFAHAAQVYLHTTISGPHPTLEEVTTSVTATMNALNDLRAISDSQNLRSLVWPICIAGCMANDATTQSFFRDLLEGLGEEARVFGNSGSVLRIMEKCWEHRRSQDLSNSSNGDCDWMKAMELTGQMILLV